MEKKDKILIGRPDDLMSLKVLKVNDVYEVSPSETYLEIIEYPLLPLICKDYIPKKYFKK
ncbi:MAG TPA: hypothetical protein P5513_06835 [Candidatus Diapherotrites archaeon]|nr:hypothetical protein [Candidatus Diapherotrites archaeon]